MVDNKDKKVLNVPALRFPEFTEEWRFVHLGEVAEFQKQRISTAYSIIAIIFRQKIFCRILKAYSLLPLYQQIRM